MSDTAIGPGQPCWECGQGYGLHTKDCPLGNVLQAEREAEQRKAIIRDCGHDWKPSGLCLVKVDEFYNSVVSNKGAIEVHACAKCGLLRMPKEK